ncbi:hypothetical protein CQZ98_11840 [Pseudomonas sp. MYb115]|nr:hypothetical protein CQZ98_11840 [Pseudomonas sp. MYb115]
MCAIRSMTDKPGLSGLQGRVIDLLQAQVGTLPEGSVESIRRCGGPDSGDEAESARCVRALIRMGGGAG